MKLSKWLTKIRYRYPGFGGIVSDEDFVVARAFFATAERMRVNTCDERQHPVFVGRHLGVSPAAAIVAAIARNFPTKLDRDQGAIYLGVRVPLSDAP